MKIAVLSDIHSNLQALEAALERIDQERIDEVQCLGDIVGYGGNPNECVSHIRARCTMVVKGNHDLATIDITHSDFHPEAAKVSNAWTFNTLSEENRSFLAWLPFRRIDNNHILVHSNPESPFDWMHVNSIETAARQFSHFSTPVCFVGHTHIPSIIGEDLQTYKLRRGMKFIINVGSVGQPRDGNPQLSFGIFDTEAWTYENIRLRYDIYGARNAIFKAGLPSILADRLEKGV